MKRVTIRFCLIALCAFAVQARAEVGVWAGKEAKPGSARCTNNNQTVPCPDFILFHHEGKRWVQDAFVAKDFAKVDEYFVQWNTGADRFPDGSWKLAIYDDALWQTFIAWKKWEQDLDDIRLWQKQSPDSFAAQYVEALYWRAYGWKARGPWNAHEVSKESLALFRMRVAKADAILKKLAPKGVRYPAWHAARIRVSVELGRKAEAEKSFVEAQRRFPEYHVLYFAMARAYEPRSGGSVEAYDRFARDVAKQTAAFEGNGMYSRLYWLMDYDEGIPFVPGKSTYPDWSRLKSGFDDLESRYPVSKVNLNQFASVACRADDGALYRRLRTKVDGYAGGGSAFRLVPLEQCDERHGWTQPKAITAGTR
jgi:hypothetical protein